MIKICVRDSTTGRMMQKVPERKAQIYRIALSKTLRRSATLVTTHNRACYPECEEPLAEDVVGEEHW
jgi:hypothetical protein